MSGERSGENVVIEGDDPLEGLDKTGFTEEELAELAKPDEEVPVEGPSPEPEKPEEPEQPEASEEPEEPSEHPKGYVPVQAIREAREELKATKTDLQQMRETFNRLAERVAEHRAQDEPEAEPEIDLNEDPLAYIQKVGQTVEELQKQSTETAAKEREYQERAAQETAIIDNVLTYRAELEQNDPEIAKAFDHAVESTVKAYQAKGFHGNALREAMRQEVIRYAQNAPQDPQELKQYTLQNARFWGYGYNDAQEAPKEQPKAIEAVGKIAAAQNASKTLSGGGTSSGPQFTLADVEAMSPAELDRIALKDPALFEALERAARGE